MGKLQGYRATAVDWRTALRNNENNTRNVIVLFIIIYMLVGFLLDVYFNSVPLIDTSLLEYPPQSGLSESSLLPDTIVLEEVALKLITFKIIPFATFAMIGIALFSLFITFMFHKNLVMSGTNHREITQDTADSIEEKQLFNVMEELKIAAALHYMPKIYIIEADYMNAFASGFSEKSAMVAITRGLLQKLDRNELQAVMAHELSHIRHNDIRLTLTVTLLSNLILIALDLLFRGVVYGRNRNGGLTAIILLARFLLPILTVLLILYLSRTREYMADSGSVELTRDNEPLARALIKIHTDTVQNKSQYQQEYRHTANEEVRVASYLYDPRYAGISMLKSINALFSTHPSLENRLKALGFNPQNLNLNE